MRLSVPYVLAALAGVVSETSGVVNLALEGLMLFSAFAAAICALNTHSALIGTLGAMSVGALIGLSYCLAATRRGTDQVLLGIAVNIAAIGITRFLLKRFYDSTSNSPYINSDIVLMIPIILVVGFVLVVLAHSVWGKRVIAAGDHPQALVDRNISVRRIQLMALTIAGGLCGLAGAFLTFSQHQFTDGITAGRGYIAVAAVVFSGWKAERAILTCLFFAAAESLGITLQGRSHFPPQLLQSLPYLLCLFALIGKQHRGRAPYALGRT